MSTKKSAVNTPIKILIIRMSSIGDILLSTPFIRQVRKKFIDAEIDFVVKDIFKDLVVHNVHLDTIHSIDLTKEKKVLKGQLRQKSYDIVFDLHNNIRSNFLRRGLGAKSVNYIRKSKYKQQVLVHLKLNLYKRYLSIPDRYLAVGTDYNITDDGGGLELYWHNDDVLSANKILSKIGLDIYQPFICIAPGAGFFTKRWPEERYRTLISLIQKGTNNPIAILGGKDDIDLGKHLADRENIYNLSGKLNLLENAFVLSQSQALVSNDSGLMHMAAAVHTPVAAIFGSTVKEWGFFPFRVPSAVIEESSLSCRPCSHIGRDKCPRKHFKCMLDITAEEVYQQLNNLISN